MMKMMKSSSSISSSSLLYVVMVFSLVWALSAESAFDCGYTEPTFDSMRPKFTSLSVFPNPARVGQQVHIRTVMRIPDTLGLKKGDIKDGLLSMELKFRSKVIASITGIPLCTASSAIVCSTLAPGDNAISFDYIVPKIPPGDYQITLRMQPNKTTSPLNDGCLAVAIAIQDADNTEFLSWIKAQLAGVSQFEHDDYLKRNLQEFIQVGPVGNIDPIVAYTFPWGTFISLSGSEDLILPNFIPGGYVWGLHGEMTEITYHGTTRDHVYKGDFYIGYVSSLAKRTLDVEILTGTFLITWHISKDADGVISSTLSGDIYFDADAELPLGFSNPILVGRLGSADVFTDPEGLLTVKGEQKTCLNNPNCNAPNYNKADNGDDLSGWQIGLITAVIVGVALIFVVVISLWKWHKRSKRHEEEDGIFSATRKPEYGNALVVDDIIQETREHSPNLMPPLNRRDQDFTDTETDDFSRSRSRSRSVSRSPPPYARYNREESPAKSVSRSRSPSRDRSASRSYSDSEDYSDAGSSASRA